MIDPGPRLVHGVGATSRHISHDPGGIPALETAGAVDAPTAGAVDAPAAGAVDSCAADALVRALYEQNASFVLSYVTGLLNDRHLAEDVVQETMLRAWRHCGSFNPEKGSVRGWLVRVAHNIAMDKLRMRRSRPIEIPETSGPEPQVGDHADRVVTAIHVRQALARLSPGQRHALEQVYMNGLTAGEAAVVLGIPEGTVFSRAYYGLRILRRELGVPPAGARSKERSGGPPGTLAA